MACTVDFRSLDEGFGGKTYKRKRSDQAQELNGSIIQGGGDNNDSHNAAATPPSKRQALPSSDNSDKPVFGKPTYDCVIAGKVSGHKWKQPRTRRASASKVRVKGTTFEQRMKQKAIKRAYKERKTELKEEIRNNKAEKRKMREEREKRKQENILRSGTKLQKITNPKTLRRRMSKSRQKKLLKVVPDDLLRKKN